MGIELDRVTAVIEAVAREELLPRFGRLASSDLFAKDSPGDAEDIVTAADHAVERRLNLALRSLLPGAPVIGEEAAHADPSLLALLGRTGPVWLVDPLDGTRNFVAGDERFGVMVALLWDGETRAAWIHLPVAGRTVVAEAGSGATVNGAPLRVPPPVAERALSGTLYTRFMPPELRAAVERRASGCWPVALTGAACQEYPAVAEGAKSFVLYYRLLPWDHAPGALVVTEAGGVVRHPDGTSYRPTDQAAPTLVAASEACWQQARRQLFPTT